MNVLNGTAAVTDFVPIGYDARNMSIKLMEVQQNCPSRLTITYFNKKSCLNSTQPLYPNAQTHQSRTSLSRGQNLGLRLSKDQ